MEIDLEIIEEPKEKDNNPRMKEYLKKVQETKDRLIRKQRINEDMRKWHLANPREKFQNDDDDC